MPRLRQHFLGYTVLLVLMIVGPSSLANKHFGSQPYIPIEQLATQLKLEYTPIPTEQSTKLSNQRLELIFENHRKECLINKKKVYLGFPIILHHNKLWISQKDCDYTLSPLLTPQRFRPVPKLHHIVIDPGHGGKDRGTENKALQLVEKNLTLDVALRLEKILKQEGFKVTLTRHNDHFVDLYDRSKKANQLKADLFISIHFNAVALNTQKVSGTETYILPPSQQPSSDRNDLLPQDNQIYPGNHLNTWNMLLGYYIQSSLLKNLHTEDRGLKKARFAVLKDLQCPGVLVESGFLTHPEEGKKISTHAYRQSIAESIAQGVLHYQKVLKKYNP